MVFKQILGKMGRMYRGKLYTDLNKYGLRYHDLLMEVDPVVMEAVRRLPPRERAGGFVVVPQRLALHAPVQRGLEPRVERVHCSLLVRPEREVKVPEQKRPLDHPPGRSQAHLQHDSDVAHIPRSRRQQVLEGGAELVPLHPLGTGFALQAGFDARMGPRATGFECASSSS